MSESCYRGYKCMCFQCGEKDCERYEPEPPKWIEALRNDEVFMKAMRQIGEKKEKRQKRARKSLRRMNRNDSNLHAK